MIGKISGRLDYVADDHALIEAAGVGYVVHCSPRTLGALPRPGERAALYTELVVREDLMQLYGFPTLMEKEWWRLLTSIQGVGAKAALAILGVLGPEGVSRAITLGDAASIKRAPGVGPKIAARVVNELKDKAPSVMAMGAAAARQAGEGLAEVLDDGDAAEEAPAPKPRRAKAPKDDAAAAARAASAAAQADALSALGNLGYAPGDAAEAVARAAEAEEGADAAALIRAALRLLAPAG
ncbi:Holliday junction branch migration protein RuvA [Rhodovulum sp. DZ06]|uniref:Holliday junction branch migration protein RuvA n=1 Tax=Rhodovulum sp. DZ06 TaxID=3425126 RepID=UPI003D327469